MASWGACLAFAAVALLIAPSVFGRSMEAPLPPVAVTATSTDAGAVVSWLPPLYDGGHAILAYSVHRLQDDGIGWDELGTVPTNATSFLDPATVTGMVSVYYVLAYNEKGGSPQSQPASTSQDKAMCEPVGIEGTSIGIDKNCLPIEVAILYLGEP